MENRSRVPPQSPSKPDTPNGSKVHQLSHGKELYAPQKRERKTDALLTADQYARKAQLEEPVSGLIRSLCKTKVLGMAEWERERAALLRKKIW